MSQINEYIRLLNESEDQLDDLFLDGLFGIETMEHQIDSAKAHRQYGHEQFTYEGTSYEYIRYFLNVIKPAKHDIVYDLGCGYGRVVLYGALNYPATFHGIEIIPERLLQAKKIKNQLALENANFTCGNVLEQDFSDGTVFFLFNPFAKKTLIVVSNLLAKINQRHPIKVVSWGGPSNEYLAGLPWLAERFGAKSPFYQLHFFESISNRSNN